MNALHERDELFSRLHGELLRLRGFKKRGQWSVRDLGTHAHTFYLRSSRFGTREKAIFWIDVQVFSAGWLRRVFPEQSYNVPAEGTPSLLMRELGAWTNPPQGSHTIHDGTDIDELFRAVREATEAHALPLLDSCASLEGLLEQLKSDSSGVLSLVGLLCMLGRDEEARYHMQMAKQRARHDNDRGFLEYRERAIWGRTV